MKAEQQMIQAITMPAAPLLTPLSVQSSPSSSIFLDQTVDVAEKASHQGRRQQHISPLSWLDDANDEADGDSVGGGRLPERSHWSDDSDVDDQEEDQRGHANDDDNVRDAVTPTNMVVPETKEVGVQGLERGGKEALEKVLVVGKTTDEKSEPIGDAVAENYACRVRKSSRKDGFAPKAVHNHQGK